MNLLTIFLMLSVPGSGMLLQAQEALRDSLKPSPLQVATEVCESMNMTDIVGCAFELLPILTLHMGVSNDAVKIRDAAPAPAPAPVAGDASTTPSFEERKKKNMAEYLALYKAGSTNGDAAIDAKSPEEEVLWLIHSELARQRWERNLDLLK